MIFIYFVLNKFNTQIYEHFRFTIGSPFCLWELDYYINYIYLCRQVNKPEAASSLLDKAAKIVEKARPEDAIGKIHYINLYYQIVAEAVAVVNRPNSYN